MLKPPKSEGLLILCLLRYSIFRLKNAYERSWLGVFWAFGDDYFDFVGDRFA